MLQQFPEPSKGWGMLAPEEATLVSLSLIPAGAKDFLESRSTAEDRGIWGIFFVPPNPINCSVVCQPVQIRRSTNLHVMTLLSLYL